MAKRIDSCIFCNKPAETLEHVLPAWTYELEAGAIGWKIVKSGGNESTRAWFAESARRTLRVHVVCTSCNNGWMSRLEEAYKPLLLRLLAGRPVTLSLEEQRLVSRWALKTAIVAEHGVSERRKHFLQPHRELFASRDDGLLSNAAVYVVAHAGYPDRSVGVSHFRFHLQPNRYGYTNLRGFVASFNVQNVGFQVLAWRRNEEDLHMPRALTLELHTAGDWSRAELQLWPNRDHDGVIWKPTEMLAGNLFQTEYHDRWKEGAKRYGREITTGR